MAADAVTAANAASTALDIWKISIPALAALLGVMIGGVLQFASASYVAKNQRTQRLDDEKAARDRDALELEENQRYVRAILARHLEAYARACADAMWANDDETEGAKTPPDFPDWPPDIVWRLLSTTEMMAIRDIETRVDIQRHYVTGMAAYHANDVHDFRSYYQDGAARIGFDAWSVSKGLRQRAKVDPFEFPNEGGNFAESLADRVMRLDEEIKEAARKDDLDK